MTHTIPRLRAAGFTLVEVIIAMLIGVIGIVVMMQTFAVSEGFKRTTTSGTDSQINGAVALYLLEREIRNAGYNMNAMLTANCTTVRAFGTATAGATDLRMVPFEINPAGIPAGDANTDVILVAFGSSDASVVGTQAQQATDNTKQIRLYSNVDGYRSGDLIVALQPDPGKLPFCALHEITNAPYPANSCTTPSGVTETALISTTNYKSFAKACNLVAPTHNSAGALVTSGGTLIPFLEKDKGGTIYNLGGNAQAKVYAIRGGNLTSCDTLTSNCALVANYAVIVNDIVSLRAVYGRDTTMPNQDFVVDTWTRSALTTDLVTNLSTRTLAVALEVTARSGVKEKPTTGTVCDATINSARPDRAQDWFGPALTPGDATLAGAQIDLSTSSADWQCYRYKLFQTTVPIRNMIWRP